MIRLAALIFLAAGCLMLSVVPCAAQSDSSSPSPAALDRTATASPGRRYWAR